ASMAMRACWRSRASGETRRKPSDAVAVSACKSRSATLTRASASGNSSSVGISLSATDRLRCADLLGVDLLEGRAFLEALDLALGGIPVGDCEIRRSPDLVRDGRYPLDQLLDSL